MVDRKDIINHLYHKRELVRGFDFDGLSHPPISMYLTEEDIMRLNQLALSARLNAKPKEKYKAMDDIMRCRGFTRLHAGTNRLVYKSEYDDSIVMKVGIDKVGITDNPSEFYNQQALKPFCCKIFDVTPCGTVAMVERVEAVRNRQQFEEIAENGTIVTEEKEEMVNHPNHYAWLKELCGIEPIDICRHLDFNCGSAIKYLLRKGKKEMNLSEREQRVQDLSKAIFYLQDEIDMIKNSK